MASSSFTFVNTTDGAALSHAASKQMRAHVTKTNFAKRRQRLGKAPPQAGRTNVRGSMTMHQGPNAPVQSALVAGFHKRWHPSLLEARDSDDPQAKFSGCSRQIFHSWLAKLFQWSSSGGPFFRRLVVYQLAPMNMIGKISYALNLLFCIRPLPLESDTGHQRKNTRG